MPWTPKTNRLFIHFNDNLCAKSVTFFHAKTNSRKVY